MKNIAYLTILILLTLSCAGPKQLGSSKNEHLIETGIASWYGPGFQGKKTANGETFDTRGLTAAHRTLPFNTKLRVENLNNGKSVIVRVNDRGPYAKDRIIDLSKAAAKQIDMIDAGTARVQLFLLGDPSSLGMENIKKPTYAIQIGSFSDVSSAKKKATGVKDAWVHEVMVGREKVYRVLVGKYQHPSEAEKLKAKLKKQGIDGFIKQIEN